MSQELLLKEKLEKIQEMSLKEKLHLMADTIRNHQGIEQVTGTLWQGDNRMCVMGLLGYRAGLSKDDLGYEQMWIKFNISKVERSIDIQFPSHLKNKREFKSQLRWMFELNDTPNLFSFDQIAEILDYTANKL